MQNSFDCVKPYFRDAPNPTVSVDLLILCMASPYLKNNPRNPLPRSSSIPPQFPNSQLQNRGSMTSRSNYRERANEANVTLMELENNQRWAELGEQVDLLKEVSPFSLSF
jgi:hypothetical protein